MIDNIPSFVKIFGVVCADENMGIGYKGDLLFHIKEDMRHFAHVTKRSILIMGRKTYESFPNGEPLKGRPHIVISSRPVAHEDGTKIISVRSVEEAIQAACELSVRLQIANWAVIGGAAVYKAFLPFMDWLHLTYVHRAASDVDVFFPLLYRDLKEWRVEDHSLINSAKFGPMEIMKMTPPERGLYVIDESQESSAKPEHKYVEMVGDSFLKLGDVRIRIRNLNSYMQAPPSLDADAIVLNCGESSLSIYPHQLLKNWPKEIEAPSAPQVIQDAIKELDEVLANQ